MNTMDEKCHLQVLIHWAYMPESAFACRQRYIGNGRKLKK